MIPIDYPRNYQKKKENWIQSIVSYNLNSKKIKFYSQNYQKHKNRPSPRRINMNLLNNILPL
jgi:hypothetical protein